MRRKQKQKQGIFMRLFLSGILLILGFGVNAQERYYSEPLKIPLLVTGSFAELRSNHFHSGIDLKTEGRTGLEVLSTADGFISRIVVSPVGFGNAIYIDHPNGTTSVYGHLSKFRKDMDDYIKEIQYKNEDFQVDISTEPHKFSLKKGELIAYSGNSGGSGGPHLHFEIRDTKTQQPVNPIEYGLYIKDTTPPKFLQLKIYPMGPNSHVNYSRNPKKYPIVFYGGQFHVKNNPKIPVFGTIGFAVETVDYIDGTWSKCGINSLSLTLDGTEEFLFNLQKFPFDQTRYINSHIDYSEFVETSHRFQKAWKDPGNKLSIYGTKVGLINFNEGEHTAEIRISDSNGKTSMLSFNLVAQKMELPFIEKENSVCFSYNKPIRFETDELKLSGEAGSIYTDIDFNYDNFIETDNPSLFSKIHQVHCDLTPVQSSLQLSIKAEGIPQELKNKALIAKRNKKTGRLSSVGGDMGTDGWISTKIRYFGDYVVTIDTVAPTISSLSIRANKTLIETNRIRFKITDSLSGIKSYRGTIDGSWALFEYDQKNNLLTYTIDPSRIKLKQQHSLQLEVFDRKNNQSVYKAVFYK